MHVQGILYTYIFSGPNTLNPNMRGMVRVVYNPEPTSDIRVLIKGMKGEVCIFAR